MSLLSVWQKLTRWLAKFVGDTLARWAAGVLLVAVPGAAVVAALRTWIGGAWAALISPAWWSVPVDRWQVPVWIFPAVLLIGAAWFIGKRRGYQAGHGDGHVAGTREVLAALEGTGPAEVLAVDKRCRMLWRVTVPLRDIQALNVDGCSPEYLRNIVDGPFHMDKNGKCNERMQLHAYDPGDLQWQMIFLCLHCDKNGPEDMRDVEESAFSRIRGDVILELQRLTRKNGGTLESAEGRIQLLQPLYWDRIDERRG